MNIVCIPLHEKKVIHRGEGEEKVEDQKKALARFPVVDYIIGIGAGRSATRCVCSAEFSLSRNSEKILVQI